LLPLRATSHQPFPEHIPDVGDLVFVPLTEARARQLLSLECREESPAAERVADFIAKARCSAEPATHGLVEKLRTRAGADALSLTIAPSHACFDDALDFFAVAFTPPELFRRQHDFRLVHGICLSSGGELFAHAWVEDLSAELVWQSGVPAAPSSAKGETLYYFALPKAEFERLFLPQKSVAYTLPEAVEQNMKHQHYGPWRQDLRDLCSGEPKILGVVNGLAPVAVIRVTLAETRSSILETGHEC